MPIFKNMVTCMYCKHHLFVYEESMDFSLDLSAHCEMQDSDMPLNGDICVNFEIKPGMHTNKWHHDKK